MKMSFRAHYFIDALADVRIKHNRIDAIFDGEFLIGGADRRRRYSPRDPKENGSLEATATYNGDLAKAEHKCQFRETERLSQLILCGE